MTKKNYHKTQAREYEKAFEVKRTTSPTNCYKCDGYDMTCTRYKPVSDLYTSNCWTKRNLQPESRLEELCHTS